MKQKKQSKNYTAPALDKGLDILELLSENKEGLTQAEIANRLNKSVNEIYRMISTLRNREYVDFDQDEDRYNLSYKILNMTAKFEPVKTLISKAIPIMKEIAMKANQSVHLAIYTRGKILIIAQEDSPSSFNYHVSVGATFDLLETSSGRVILTFQKEKERKRRLERRKFYKKFESASKIPTKQLKDIEKKFSNNSMQKISKKKFFNDNGYLIINKFYDLKAVNSSYTEINKGQNEIKKFLEKGKNSLNNFGFAYEKTFGSN